MSRKYLTGIDLSQNQILNVALQNLASDPASPVAGQIYYNTAGSVKIYNGSAWQTVTTGTINTLTFNNAGSGGTSGSTYNGGSTLTVSYNTIGAAPTASPTFTGTVTTPLTTAGIVLTSAAGVLSSTATIADSYLATISTAGKVLNSATTAASANTVSAIVARDASGNFSAGTITASLTGTASFATTANAVAIANVTGLGTSVASSLAQAIGTLGAPLVFNGALGTPSSGTLTNATGLPVATGISGLGTGVATFLATPTSANLATALTDETGYTTGALNVFNINPSITGATFTGTVTVPTPVNGTDAANKSYVDTVATGMNAHDAVAYATTKTLATNFTASSGTVGTTYNNGTSGVGATLTVAITGGTTPVWTAITIDGQSLTIGDRVLIKDESTLAWNGIYTVTTVGTTANSTSFVFTRATDSDQTPELAAGDLTYVLAGTINGKNGFVETSVVTTIGTSSVTWSQFSGSSTTLAGLGLVTNGTNPNQLDINVDGTSLAITGDTIGIKSTWAGQTAITTLGNVTSGTWSASVVGPTYGGTGVNNGSNTITLGGNLTTSGAFATTLTVTGATNVTLPTSGTLVNSAVATLSSLTSVGTIGTGTWQATAIGVLYGGTGATTAAGARTNLSSTAFALPQKYAASNGALTAVSGVITWTVTHNLGTTDVVVMVYTAAGAQVEVDVVTTSTSVVTLTFNSASLTGNEYRVVVIG